MLLAGFVQFDNDDIELFAVDSDKRGVEILDGDAREGTSLDSFEFTVAEFCGLQLGSRCCLICMEPGCVRFALCWSEPVTWIVLAVLGLEY